MPTTPPRVVIRNIGALVQARERGAARLSRAQRFAARITQFSGHIASVVVHAVLFGGWILLNSNVLPVRAWDPFPFVMLAMWASVEAIFLSTFVLISQNRMSELADQRAELDLQINLLAEHEITHVLDLVDAIAKRLGVTARDPHEIESLKQEVTPETLLDELGGHPPK